ncbi:hypothetical protein [Streptomyces chartreusis]|uniref:hypothetical protein n=1 Tax=Streptomyces chartreusis TaxID=1969 RepID=UPI0037F50739
MSRVYFHSPTRTAELHGSERAWMSGLVEDIAVGMLGLHSAEHVDRLVGMASPSHYIAQHADRYPSGMPLATAYRLSFLHDDSYTEPVMTHRGRRIDTFALALNTALQLGSDQIKLAARLHGACELHTWVDGPNRAWLADVMQAGVDSGVYRRRMPYHGLEGAEPGRWTDQGWDDVIALLRERDDEPVVTSYSVTDQFPNPGPDAEYNDDWYRGDTAVQWRLGMEWLRASTGLLEMKPDDWATYRFEHRLTLLDLFAPDWEDRLTQAIAEDDEAARTTSR